MANHVFNHVTFTGVKPEDMDKLIDAIQQWKLCQTYYPEVDEVRADIVCWELREAMISKLSRLHNEWYNVEKWWNKIDDFFPAKDLRYNRRCNNWWSKRDIFDTSVDDVTDTSVDCVFSTAWSPVLPALKKISEVLHCAIEVSYDEPWNCFSWTQVIDNWEVIEDNYYNDAYFGNWCDCEICWAAYDLNNPDDWYELADFVWGGGKRNICTRCWEKLNEDKEDN